MDIVERTSKEDLAMLRIRELMNREVVSLDPQATVAEALQLCTERRIRHVPVLEEGRLVGIVSDRDLREAGSHTAGEEAVEQAAELMEVRLADVMSREVLTAHPQDPVGYAARQMESYRINALPVVEEPVESMEGSASLGAHSESELLGMVTSTDLMRALAALTGVGEFGSQVEVQVPDRPGIVAEVVGEIQDSGQDIEGVLSSPERRAGNRTLLVRVAISDPQVVVEGLQLAGYAASPVIVPDRPPGG